MQPCKLCIIVASSQATVRVTHLRDWSGIEAVSVPLVPSLLVLVVCLCMLQSAAQSEEFVKSGACLGLFLGWCQF